MQEVVPGAEADDPAPAHDPSREAIWTKAILALLVEPDEDLGRPTSDFLEERGVAVVRATDGETALKEAQSRAFDVIVLGILIPRYDGFRICRELRATSNVPIILVTEGASAADRIVGLELGADDCLSEPYSRFELLARLRALVRRTRSQMSATASILRAGPLELRPRSMTAIYGGRKVALTGNEFTVLRVLAERRGRVLSRERILELAQGTSEQAFERAVDVSIFRIRRKLGEDTGGPSIIRTVRGAGYVLAWEGIE